MTAMSTDDPIGSPGAGDEDGEGNVDGEGDTDAKGAVDDF